MVDWSGNLSENIMQIFTNKVDDAFGDFMERFFLLRAAVAGVSVVLLVVTQVFAQKSLDEL